MSLIRKYQNSGISGEQPKNTHVLDFSNTKEKEIPTVSVEVPAKTADTDFIEKTIQVLSKDVNIQDKPIETTKTQSRHGTFSSQYQDFLNKKR